MHSMMLALGLCLPIRARSRVVSPSLLVMKMVLARDRCEGGSRKVPRGSKCSLPNGCWQSIKTMSRRRKAMFLTPWESLCPAGDQGRAPTYVEELLSEDSLRRAGYFDPQNVTRWRTDVRKLRRGSLLRMSIEMCLVGVVSTQLWHHTFIDGSLMSLPSQAGRIPDLAARPMELHSISVPAISACQL